MKKVLAVLLAAAMTFSLAACGNDSKETKAPETKAAESKADETKAAESKADETKAAESKAAESKADETNAAGPAAGVPTLETAVKDVNNDGKVVVGYISKNFTDVFHIAINKLAEDTFTQWAADGKIDEFTGVLNGETKGEVQVNLANDCIQRNCDFVIILPAEYDTSDKAVTTMVEAGINVLVVNSETASTRDMALALSISDDVEAGEMLGNWVLEKCPDGGKYLHCQGAPGNSAMLARTEGIHNVLDSHSEFEMIGEAYNEEWSADSAVNQATEALTKYGDELVAVVCDNDDMSSAVQRYMNNNGRSDMICVGVDGNEGPLQMVKDGELGATVYQDGVGQLQQAIDIIDAIISGTDVPEIQPIPFILVTAENVDQYLK